MPWPETARNKRLNTAMCWHPVSLLGGRHQHSPTRRGLHLSVAGIIVLLWTLMHAAAAEISDVARGQQLYQHYCAACHGTGGTGTGVNAPYLERLGRAPADHSDLRSMNRLSDADLYRAISEGKRRDGEPPFMPWWGLTLAPEDIWNLVAFIRTLAKESSE